jgi:hypothetical protein
MVRSTENCTSIVLNNYSDDCFYCILFYFILFYFASCMIAQNNSIYLQKISCRTKRFSFIKRENSTSNGICSFNFHASYMESNASSSSPKKIDEAEVVINCDCIISFYLCLSADGH